MTADLVKTAAQVVIILFIWRLLQTTVFAETKVGSAMAFIH